MSRRSLPGSPGRRVVIPGLVIGLALIGWWSWPAAEEGKAPWPHEPTEHRVLRDEGWRRLPAPRWEIPWASPGTGRRADAPESPPEVLEIIYPAGFAGGSAPATVATRLPTPRELYVGIWWRPSADWQGHASNVNKLQFVFPADGGDITMVMYGPPEGPFELRVLPQFPGLPSDWLLPNMDSVPVALGEWHRVEWLLRESSAPGRPDGSCRWWIDGRPVGDYQMVPFPADPFDEYKLSPTWGGVGDLKQRVDTFQFDHFRLTMR